MKHFFLPLLFMVLMHLCTWGQVFEQYWPVEFGDPDQSDFVVEESEDTLAEEEAEDTQTAEASPVDSSVVMLRGKAESYQNAKAFTNLNWEKLLPNGRLEQVASYQYSQQTSSSSIQTFDAAGSVMFHHVRGTPFDAGFVWTPMVSYSKKTVETISVDSSVTPKDTQRTSRRVGALQSSADIGPVVAGALRGIPFSVKAGLYGYTWNDSITPWLLSTTDGAYRTAPGVFGGFDLGGDGQLSEKVPLQFSLSTLGRSAGGNNFGLMRTGALFADETGVLGGGDSLYLGVGDSITNGKELYIGDFEGNSFYSNTSWRVNHSFSAGAGLRMKERLATIIRSYYRYGLNSISYPNEPSGRNDRRTTSQLFGIAARTRKNRTVVYNGGLELGWDFEDYLYRRSFGNNDYPSNDEFDLYVMNLYDHYTDRARTDQDVTVTLPAGFSVNYHFTAVKVSERYPFVFRESLTMQRRNQNENDRVENDNRLSLQFVRDSSLSVSLYGKMGRTYLYYYHENRAAESRVTDQYRTGINVRFTAGPVSLREHLYADAEVSDNYFKKVGDKPTAAPPYQRNISSSLSGVWNISQRISLNGSWVNIYKDEGYWYGKAYHIDSTAGDAEFYAIESKNTQYWVDCSLRYLVRDWLAVNTGSKFSDIFERRYDFDLAQYRNSDLDVGYGIEPYIKASVDGGFYGGTVSVRRIFNTEDAARWKKDRNWYLALSLQVKW